MISSATDLRADMAALLLDKTRRDIRDLLRHSDPLTLTEIAKSIGQSEQNTYYHLNKMHDANIVVKYTTKLNGRLVTVYTLSDQYEQLFSEPKPDITPLFALLITYSISTLLLIFIPDSIMFIYNIFGVKHTLTALALNLVGLITTLTIVLIYTIRDFIDIIRYKLPH